MIARFRALLPFAFSIRYGDELLPYEFTEGDYHVKVYPPCKAAVNPRDAETVSPVPLLDIVKALKPADPQEATGAITMDGAPTIQANLLQIDFLKSDFERRRASEDFEGDPPIGLAFRIVNDLLARLRTVTGGSHIKSASKDRAFWRLDYLTDDGKELAQSPDLVRARYATPVSWHLSGVNVAVWTMVQALPVDFTHHAWDTLLLDAEALLLEVGASIVLSYAALETFIAWSLDQLPPLSTIPPDLWKWINDRGDWYKEPSVSEQYDRLLRVLTGKSLKEEPQLWEALQNLRDARNSFAHQGKAVLGGRAVSLDQATRLVSQAKAIIAWVELLMPEAMRRPRYTATVNWGLQKQVTPLPGSESEVRDEGADS